MNCLLLENFKPNPKLRASEENFTNINVWNLPYFTLSDKQLYVNLDILMAEGPKVILAP